MSLVKPALDPLQSLRHRAGFLGGWRQSLHNRGTLVVHLNNIFKSCVFEIA
jgi:hypothetical protein